VAVKEKNAYEYDMHYQSADTELHEMARSANDPRLIGKRLNLEYDITDSSPDYFMLNGRSFPYTIRESLIIAEPDQNIKIRMFNSTGEMLAVHTHGHKATITHYDGVEHNPAAQITRDIYDLAPSQRNDLRISTVDDGLHSYGEGIWIFHDHREKGITTDGMNPGGNVSALVYKSYLNDKGMPKVQGVDISPMFTKAFFERKVPVWQDADAWNSLGEVNAEGYVAPPPSQPVNIEAPPSAVTGVQAGDNAFRNFIVGLIFGMLAYLLIINREKIMRVIASLKEGGKQ
ncbi:MAG: multicopper oxidase domain-containing protein, partial [Gammaproteobacteria bacterium]